MTKKSDTTTVVNAFHEDTMISSRFLNSLIPATFLSKEKPVEPCGSTGRALEASPPSRGVRRSSGG